MRRIQGIRTRRCVPGLNHDVKQAAPIACCALLGGYRCVLLRGIAATGLRRQVQREAERARASYAAREGISQSVTRLWHNRWRRLHYASGCAAFINLSPVRLYLQRNIPTNFATLGFHLFVQHVRSSSEILPQRRDLTCKISRGGSKPRLHCIQLQEGMKRSMS